MQRDGVTRLSIQQQKDHYFFKADENILLFTDADRKLLTGDEDFNIEQDVLSSLYHHFTPQLLGIFFNDFSPLMLIPKYDVRNSYCTFIFIAVLKIKTGTALENIYSEQA